MALALQQIRSVDPCSHDIYDHLTWEQVGRLDILNCQHRRRAGASHDNCAHLTTLVTE